MILKRKGKRKEKKVEGKNGRTHTPWDEHKGAHDEDSREEILIILLSKC